MPAERKDEIFSCYFRFFFGTQWQTRRRHFRRSLSLGGSAAEEKEIKRGAFQEICDNVQYQLRPAHVALGCRALTQQESPLAQKSAHRICSIKGKKCREKPDGIFRL